MSHEIVNSERYGYLFVERSERPEGAAWHHLARCVYAPDQKVTLQEAARDSGALYDVYTERDQIPFRYTPLDGDGNPCLDSEGRPVQAVEFMEADQVTIKRAPLYQGGQCVISPAVLGFASGKWQPIQNADVIRAFEPAARHYPVETAGVLEDGKLFFFTLNVGEIEVNSNGVKDSHVGYVWVNNWFKPGNALVVGAGSVRIVCANTNQAANAAATWKLAISHNNMASALVEASAKAIFEIGALKTAQARAYQMMADKEIDLDTARGLFKVAFPDPLKPKTLISLDKLTGSDQPISLVGNALDRMGKGIAETEQFTDYRKAKAYELATSAARVQELRETAEVSLSHMIDQGLGLNVYTTVQAITETQQHRLGRIRGNVAGDVLFGDRNVAYNRVMTAAAKLVPELC